MKTQRSRFHLISLLLLCAFLFTVLFCAGKIGLLVSPADEEAGEQPAAEESLSQPESVPDIPEPDAVPDDDPLFDTTGL